MTDSNTIRDMRKALKEQERRASRLNAKLLQFEAQQAIEQKSRVAFQMARRARFPDVGVQLFLGYLRDHPDADVKKTFADLDELYEAAGTKKKTDA